MGIDAQKMLDQVIRKLFTLTKGTPQGLDSEGKIKNRKIKFDALKTLLAYFQKTEIRDDNDDDDFNLPTTSKALKEHLAILGEKLNADESDAA